MFINKKISATSEIVDFGELQMWKKWSEFDGIFLVEF